MNALTLSAATPTIDFLTAEKLIKASGGTFFRVDFIKRTDGSLRRMLCRTGVKPDNPGSGRRYRPSDHALVSVWDCGVASLGGGKDSAYRQIPVDGITALRIRGTTYRVTKPDA